MPLDVRRARRESDFLGHEGQQAGVRARAGIGVAEPRDRSHRRREKRRIGRPTPQRPRRQGDRQTGGGRARVRLLRGAVPRPACRRPQPPSEPLHLEPPRLGGLGQEHSRRQPTRPVVGTVREAPEERLDSDPGRRPRPLRDAGQLLGEIVGPAIRVVERARRIHLEVREGPFLRERHLRRDAGEGRLLVEAVTNPQTRELRSLVAVHDHEAVEAQVDARLDEQGAVRHQHLRGTAREGRGPGGLGRAHPRVDDRVQPCPGAGVLEHQCRERGSIQRPIRAHHSDPEFAHDLGEGGTPPRGDLARDRVEIEGLEPPGGETPQHVRLAAGDSAGQAHAQHASKGTGSPFRAQTRPAHSCVGPARARWVY